MRDEGYGEAVSRREVQARTAVTDAALAELLGFIGEVATDMAASFRLIEERLAEVERVSGVRRDQQAEMSADAPAEDLLLELRTRPLRASPGSRWVGLSDG